MRFSASKKENVGNNIVLFRVLQRNTANMMYVHTHIHARAHTQTHTQRGGEEGAERERVILRNWFT